MKGGKSGQLLPGKYLFPAGAAGQDQRDGLGGGFPAAGGEQEQEAETDRKPDSSQDKAIGFSSLALFIT